MTFPRMDRYVIAMLKISFTTTSGGWQDSGAVGVTVSAGRYLATGGGWGCDVAYYWSPSGDEALPFGTSDGLVSIASYGGLTSTPWTASGWLASLSLANRYPTTYNITQ